MEENNISIFSFPSEERLKSKKTIQQLFSQGSHSKAYPLKAVYILEPFQENNSAIQAAFTVSKRLHKTAVKRTLFKRRMRESYRLNRPLTKTLLSSNNLQLRIMFIYLSKKNESFTTISDSMEKILKRLNQRLIENKDKN